jgi:hypothetical protein
MAQSTKEKTGLQQFLRHLAMAHSTIGELHVVSGSPSAAQVSR